MTPPEEGGDTLVMKTPAHPMAGFVVVAPIPAGGQPASEPREAGGLFGLVGLRIQEPGVAAGIVLEIGPLPDGAPAEYVTPYEVGHRLFYWEDGAIKLGGFHYVAITKIIAWDQGES